MKLADLLIRSAEAQPDRTAVKDRHVELSYGRMAAEVRRLSARLRSLGCAPGVKVAIALGNSVEYLVSFFAVSDAGGTILALSTRMTAYESAGYIERSDASIVITNQTFGERLGQRLGRRQEITLIHVRYDRQGELLVEVCAEAKCRVDPENGDVALMVPTSGTTGRPRIVMLTNENLISNLISYRSVMETDHRETAYCVLSLHYIYCICAQVLTHLSSGDTLVISGEPFFIRDFLKAVEAHDISITAFVPYMAILLAEYPRSDEFDIGSLRRVTLSGAKTPRATYELLTSKYPGVEFVNTYGMSEAGSRISIAAPSPVRFPPDSVGKPIPGVELRVVDGNGRDVGPDQPGEILVRSSGVMKGYYKQPGLTAEAIAGDWLRTADVGKLDESGNLYLLGRLKDIIIVGGDNVCPGEIEECLTEHPAVLDAAVVAQKHRLLQEAPCAFVVKRDRSTKLTPIDIVEFCRNRLSSHKIPTYTTFLERLPKLASSKVDRDALKKMADELSCSESRDRK